METQRLRKFGVVLLSLVLILSVGFIGGCSDDDDDDVISGDQNDLQIIQGWVSLEGPISGATIALFNIDGEEIYKSSTPATGDLGSFLIGIDDLPADFRIVSSGGTSEEEAISAELSAEYQGFNAETGTIYINAVTTMVCSYLDSNPGKTLDEATTAVKGFLEIPERVDIGRGLHAPGAYFNYGEFLYEADQNGGLNDYVDQMVSELDSGNATHPFAMENHGLLGGNGLLGGAGADAGMFVAKGLASGALSYIGGNVLGWGLSELGLGFGDKTAEELEKIQQQLAQMQAQLDQMQQQLTQISQQLDHLEAQMQQLGSELSSEIKQTDYDTRVGQMISLINSILSIRDKLTVYVSSPPSDPAVLDYQRTTIMNRIKNELLNHENDIHSQLTGVGMSTPLLKIWSQIVKGQHALLSSADSAKVQAQFDYFDTLQLWLTELLVEYYHALATDEVTDSPMYKTYVGEANDAVNNYNTNRAAQVELLLPAIPSGVLVSDAQNILIRPTLLYGTWQDTVDMFGQFEFPPKVGPEDAIYGRYQVAWSDQLSAIFNYKGGSSPYSYAVSEGWPNDNSLNSSWTLGIGSSQTSDNNFTVFSLSDASTRTVSCTSAEKFYWVLTAWCGWTENNYDQTDHLVKFFW